MRAVKGTEIEDLIRQHKVSGGMILKLEAAKRALAGGVSEVRIVGGTQRRALFECGERNAQPGHTRVSDCALPWPGQSGRTGAAD